MTPFTRHPTQSPVVHQSGQISSHLRLFPLVACLVATSLVACSSPGVDAPAGPAAPGPSANAVVAPVLGSAEFFVVLAGTTVTNSDIPKIGRRSSIFGKVGVSPGTAVTGFDPGQVFGGAGDIHAADAVAAQAQAELTVSYLDLAGRPCDSNLTGIDLAGKTLAPGTYCFTSEALLSGDLVLDALGSPDAVFIFQIGSKLTTSFHSTVRLINGGRECQVFWQVGSSATLGSYSSFLGTILALTSIDVGALAGVSGRLLARNGAVTLDTNRVGLPDCRFCAATRCGGACVETATDAANCGACGNACAAGSTCSAGTCSVCSGTVCGGACLATATDSANCGACGNACAIGSTCSAGACTSPPPPVCRDLGVAASFDVFTLGAFVGHDSAVEGAVAACGDFSAERYAIGSALPPDSLALVIGGDLRYRNGSVNGDVIYGGELCWLCDVAVAGLVTHGTLLDCAAASTYLLDYSASLAALPANGTTTIVDGPPPGKGRVTIFLAGSNATLNVFWVVGAVMLASTNVDIKVPAGAHVLVNVIGPPMPIRPPQAWTLNGLADGRLLVNFPSATQIELQGTSIAGSILAPLAGVSFDGGVVTGQIVAGSFIGSGQVGQAPFDACIDVRP
jgi:choice-of-anchor A domain-containing protein